MDIRKRYIFILILNFCVLTTPVSALPDTLLPNIIIFLIDDMGVMDSSLPFLSDNKGKVVRYPLNEFYRTPHMEKLAEQGVRFSQFYAHSVCSPTRTSIITGQNSTRHRVTNWINSENNNRTEFGPNDWNWKGLKKGAVTLPKLLQRAGYKTIHIGKAHYGPMGSEGEDPLNLGFDVNIGGSSIGQPGSYLGTEGFGYTGGNRERAVPGLEKYHGKEIFLTEALTLEAKNEISKAKNENKSFFLNLSHYAVHAPFYSDTRFADHYINSGRSEKAQAYATLIEGIDKSLGDVIQHVKDLGLGENTLIIFLGDNGSDAPLPVENDYSSSAPLRGKKGNHWEGGMRVPFIASWIVPDNLNDSQRILPVKSKAVQMQMATIFDIFPTLCHLANVQIPPSHVIDGFNLRQQLKGKTNTKRKEVFINHFPHGNHRSNYFTSFVHSDWKLIYHYPVNGPDNYELYNLKIDPFESNNISAQHPKKLTSMLRKLETELQNANALLPEKGGIKIPFSFP